MGYKFTLVLSREINGDESDILQKAGCADAAITSTTHPTNASLTVTQLDIDREAPSLVEAIQSALDAVKTVPDLSAPSLTVPAQPDGTSTEGEAGPTGSAAIPDSSNAASTENAAASVNGTVSGASRSRKKKQE